jgi:hypothetical protein
MLSPTTWCGWASQDLRMREKQGCGVDRDLAGTEKWALKRSLRSPTARMDPARDGSRQHTLTVSATYASASGQAPGSSSKTLS